MIFAVLVGCGSTRTSVTSVPSSVGGTSGCAALQPASATSPKRSPICSAIDKLSASIWHWRAYGKRYGNTRRHRLKSPGTLWRIGPRTTPQNCPGARLRLLLKGAMLVTTWFDDPHWPTRDPTSSGLEIRPRTACFRSSRRFAASSATTGSSCTHCSRRQQTPTMGRICS